MNKTIKSTRNVKKKDTLQITKEHIAYALKSVNGTGKNIIASYGQNPETGKDLNPIVRHFIDAEKACTIIQNLLKEHHRNIYLSLSTMRPDLKPGKKGYEKDVVSVFGFCVDLDEQTANKDLKKLPVRPTITLETSPGRFQAQYILREPIEDWKAAKELAKRLKAFPGCDYGTMDISHVWRIPGTLNWPNKKKVDAGRSSEPVMVKEIDRSDYVTKEQLLEGFPEPAETKQTLPAEPVERARSQTGGGNAWKGDISALPVKQTTKDLISNGVPVGGRSEAMMTVLNGLVSSSLSDNQIFSVFERYAIGDKYREKGSKAGWLQPQIKKARSYVTAGVATVKVISLDDALAWVDGTEKDVIINNWISKTNGLSATETNLLIRSISRKIGAGIQALNKDLKNHKAKAEAAKKKLKEAKRSAKREAEGRVTIFYDNTKTGVCVNKVSAALAKHPGYNIFRFGNELVKVCNGRPNSVKLVKKAFNAGGKYPIMPRIKKLTIETTRHEIERAVLCQAEDGTGGTKDIRVPTDLIKGLQDTHNSKERILIGLCEHPFVDMDFKAHFKKGYDQATGLFTIFENIDKFRLNFEINNATAKQAYDYLAADVLADFPFKTKLDKVAAVSCLLTGMERKAFIGDSGCPGYLFTAPMQATGKTTLAQIISYSLYNRPAAACSYSEDDDEMGKQLLGILLEGHSAILFDNIKEGSILSSNELAKAMTSTLYSKRYLGKNKTITVPSAVLWMFSGNNISVFGDFNTRFLSVNLDADMANPEKKKFKRADIGRWVSKNREKILKACLTIILNGKSYEMPSMDGVRYPEWNTLVRMPLHKITGVDIAEVFNENKTNDPKLEGQRCFFEAWYDRFGDREKTTKELVDFGQDIPDDVVPFADAMQDIFSGGGLPSTRSLGKWLSGMKDRIIGDMKILSRVGTTGKNKNLKVWKVIKIDKIPF